MPDVHTAPLLMLVLEELLGSSMSFHVPGHVPEGLQSARTSRMALLTPTPDNRVLAETTEYLSLGFLGTCQEPGSA